MKKPLPFIKLLREANEVYPDGEIETYFDMETGKERRGAHGDTLALFIGREIESVTDDTMSEEEARESVDAALTRAAEELDAVIYRIRRGAVPSV